MTADEKKIKSLKENKSKVSAEQEIDKVYKKCVSAGFNHSEIYEMARPLRKIILQEKRKQKWKKTAIFVFFLACIWSTTKIDWSPIVLSSYGRYALISMLPYWDWTTYYYKSCLIDNPFYEVKRLYEEDCEVCESLNNILQKTSITHLEMSEDYLKNDIPIVLENSLGNWNLETRAFSIFNISKVLLDVDPDGDILPCAFASNLRLRGENYFKVFLSKLQSKNILEKSWYAHWENCDKKASKILRRKYPRPDFLPPMVDATEPNWVLLSTNYQARSYKHVQLISEMMWLAQLEGSNDIRLIPRSPCNRTCFELNHVLKEGETVLFTNRLWQLQYLPGKSDVNIAIGGGGSFYDF